MSKPDLLAPVAAPKTPKGGLVLLNVPMEKVSIKKGFNPRTDLGDLGELKRSLAEHGMQVPVILCPTKDGADTYYVIAGHRRYTVWQEMGKANVPASIRADLTISSPEALALAVTENSEDVRTSLTPLDQAKVFKSLLDSSGGDDTAHLAQVGKMTGYTRTHVARTMKLLLVPKSIKERLQKGEISSRAAVAVADVPDDIRDRVIAKVGVGTTEGDVARLVNEVRREARTAGAATAPVAGRGATPAGSRHNVPVGASSTGTWVNPRNMREVRKMITAVAVDVLNCNEEIKEDESKEAEFGPIRDAKSNQLAALLWQVGGLDKIDTGTKDFKSALNEIRQRVEEQMAKAQKDKPKAKAAAADADAPPAPKANAKDESEE